MGGACSTHERLETHMKYWSENQKGRDLSEDLDVDGKIVLEFILGKKMRRCRLDASDSIGTRGGFL
jgi:hypothetical protein